MLQILLDLVIVPESTDHGPCLLLVGPVSVVGPKIQSSLEGLVIVMVDCRTTATVGRRSVWD